MRLFNKDNITIDNNKKIMLVLAFMSMSIGIWSNFRQIWLLDTGFNVDKISFILSLGMFGSCFLAVIISLFSTKVRIKEVLILTISMNIVAMMGLMFLYKSSYRDLIETFILLTIITENMFWIGIYPLFTTVKKSDKLYEKKTIVQNFTKDIGILIGGLLIGKSIGIFILNANFCLLISILISMIGLYFLIKIKYTEDINNKLDTKDLVTSFKIVFKNKIFIYYFLYAFFVNIAWDIVVGLQLILLVDGFNISESNSAYIILALGMMSTFIAVYITKNIKFKSNFRASVFKYGSRVVFYIPVFFFSNPIFALTAFAVTQLTSRSASSYTEGGYLNLADNDLQLIISNMKFFMVCLGETIGIYLSGYLFKYGMNAMFMASTVFYVISIFISYLLSNLYKETVKN